jgi:hypothetical protein
MVVEVSPQPTADGRSLQAPDAGVIEEARARQRRQRRAVGLAAVATVGLAMIGVALAGGFGGPRPLGTPGAHGSQSAVAPVYLAACGTTKSAGTAVQGPPSQSLLSILGVLRRPPTAADALPASVEQQLLERRLGPAVTLFANYVRRVGVVGGFTYWVFPKIVTWCGHSRETMAVDAYLSTSANSGDGLGTAADIENGSGYDTSVGFSSTTITMLVPDGVTTVTLRYPAGRIGGFNRHHAPATTLIAKIASNLMVITVPRSGNRATDSMTMTWRSPHGRTIKTFNRL